MREKKPLTLFDGSAAYLIAAASLVFLQFFLRWLSGTGLFRMEAVSRILSAAYYVLALGVPAAVLGARRKNGVECLRLLPISPGRAVCIVILAVIAFLLVNTLSMFWYVLVEATGGVIYDASVDIPESTAGIIGMFFLMVVLPAVFEELLFRGVILNSMESRGKRRAIVLSTLLFALMHGSFLGIPSQMIGGAIMGFIVLRLGSLYASIIYHTVFNGVAFAAMVYARGAEAASGPMLEQLGGAGGLLSLVPTVVILSLILFFHLRICVRATRPVSLDAPRETESMDWQTLLVFLSGIITCLYPLIEDLILIYGG